MTAAKQQLEARRSLNPPRSRLGSMSPAELKRLEAAWADPEVTVTALKSRFTLSQNDLRPLTRTLGSKRKPSAAERIDGGKPHRLLGNGWAT